MAYLFRLTNIVCFRYLSFEMCDLDDDFQGQVKIIYLQGKAYIYCKHVSKSPYDARLLVSAMYDLMMNHSQKV